MDPFVPVAGAVEAISFLLDVATKVAETPIRPARPTAVVRRMLRLAREANMFLIGGGVW